MKPSQPTHLTAPPASLCVLINPVPRHSLAILSTSSSFKILMASQICLDTSDNSNRSFVLGDTVCQDRNHWLTTVLAIMWALLHGMLFLSTMLPLRVNKYVRRVAPRKMS